MFYWKLIADRELLKIYHDAVNLNLGDEFVKLLSDEIQQRSISLLNTK